jgi:hypothetical protein
MRCWFRKLFVLWTEPAVCLCVWGGLSTFFRGYFFQQWYMERKEERKEAVVTLYVILSWDPPRGTYRNHRISMSRVSVWECKSEVQQLYVFPCNWNLWARELRVCSSDEALSVIFSACLRICRLSFACKHKVRVRRSLCVATVFQRQTTRALLWAAFVC